MLAGPRLGPLTMLCGADTQSAIAPLSPPSRAPPRRADQSARGAAAVSANERARCPRSVVCSERVFGNIAQIGVQLISATDQPRPAAPQCRRGHGLAAAAINNLNLQHCVGWINIYGKVAHSEQDDSHLNKYFQIRMIFVQLLVTEI